MREGVTAPRGAVQNGFRSGLHSGWAYSHLTFRRALGQTLEGNAGTLNAGDST